MPPVGTSKVSCKTFLLTSSNIKLLSNKFQSQIGREFSLLLLLAYSGKCFPPIFPVQTQYYKRCPWSSFSDLCHGKYYVYPNGVDTDLKSGLLPNRASAISIPLFKMKAQTRRWVATGTCSIVFLLTRPLSVSIVCVGVDQECSVPLRGVAMLTKKTGSFWNNILLGAKFLLLPAGGGLAGSPCSQLGVLPNWEQKTTKIQNQT